MIRRWMLILLVAGALSLGGAAAWAYWGAAAAPGGSGAAVAAAVNAATTPTVSKYAAQSVVVTWPAVTLSQSTAVDGYVVTRYDTATLTPTAALTGCAGRITALTCTETGVPTGSWRYTVHAAIGTNWVGARSPYSTTVATAPASVTLAQTLYRGPFPVTATGTLTGFGVNEAVSYRLDAATPLTGFPTVVDVTGGAPISSLSLPSAAEGPHTVTVTGANGSTASTTVTFDTVAPIVSAVLSPAPAGNGWNLTSPVQVTLSAIDGTSGVATIRYTLDGSDPVSSGTALTYTTPLSLAASATVRYYATDLAGNASTVASQLVKIDATPPVNALTLSSTTGAFLSGTTVFYRGTSAGSFALTNTLTDAGAGPVSSGTSALTGGSTGFTHTPSTVSTPAAGPYVSGVFSWVPGTTSSPTETVTGTDAAGNTAATVLTFANDSTGPTGGSVDAAGLTGTGSRYSTSTSLSVAVTRGADVGAGLAASGAQLFRSAATLTNGTCGTYGTATLVATDPASPRADTVADQACYRYDYVVPDVLGNATTYSSGDVKVDTTAPATPTFGYVASTNAYVNGSTLYYRSTSAGSFTVTAASSDAASGLSGYSFPALGTNWNSSAGATGVRTYTWTNPAAVPAGTSVTATNNAGRTATAAMTLTDDTTAPTAGSTTVNAGYVASASVPVSFTSGTETGSGINAAAGLLQRRSTTLTSPLGTCGNTWSAWATIATGPTSPYTDTTVANSTCYQYQYLASDNVGNQSAPYVGANTVKVPAYYTCSAAILAATPDEYYRLRETGTTTATDSSGNNRNGTYAGGYTQGVVGGACGEGVALNGSTGQVYTTTPFTNPTVYSTELWFRTTTVNGGKLLGFGNNAAGGGSSFYDRHIWMSRDGKLNFGTTTGVLLTAQTNITSPLVYNDNKWHHVAATQSAAGMKLYVDGVQVAQNASVSTAQNYTGYWRIGFDSMAGWWPAFTVAGSEYFGGSVSNAAVYTTKALTDVQVWDHYVAGAITTTGPVVTASSVNASAQAAGLSAGSAPPARRPAPGTPSPSPSITRQGTPPVTPSAAPSTSRPTTPAPSWSATPSVIPVPSWSATPSIPPSIAAIDPTPVLPTPLPESVTPPPGE